MQPKVQTSQWTRNQRGLAWLSFGIFCAGFVLYMVGYTGNYWYVSPVMSTFPPKNWVTEGWRLHFGLFYLCFRDHCKYDMRQDYQIVLLIPEELGQFNNSSNNKVEIFVAHYRQRPLVCSMCWC